jgi:hypothetical protein
MDNTLVGTVEYDAFKTQRCNVLFIGNSYSENTAAYMYDLFTTLGVEDFYIAVLYYGGCSIDTHLNYAQNNTAAYKFVEYNSSNTVNYTSSYTMKSAISVKEWDWIIFSQKSDDSGIESTYANLPNLISYVKEHVTSENTKYAFNMTWAWQTGYSKYSSSYGTPNDMYNKIVECINSKVLSNPDISCLIPNGTAIQNARGYIDEKNLFRDKTHLSANGCFIAGLTATFALLSKYPHYKDIDMYSINSCLPTTQHVINSNNITGAIDTSYANNYYTASRDAIHNPLSVKAV